MIKNSLTNFLNTLRHNKTVQIALILIILALGLFIMLSFDFQEAKTFIRANRSQAALISMGIYLLLGFTFIPAAPLTLFLAVYMGPIATVAIATTGNTLAALLEYQIGTTVGDVFNFEAHMDSLPFKLGKLPISSPLLLLAGRLLPLGKRGFSIVCGAYQVPLGRYLWTTVLMYIINASVLAFTGAGLVRFLQ
jgi:uncharacterized membrane protein YdjX (TVP38/TMEM64 family)